MSAQEQYSDIPRGQVIGSYDTYLEAQRAVDYLSDKQFPVQHVAIVGSDLRMVENVLGRLTRGRAALAGAASGAWFGLFVGVLLTLLVIRRENATRQRPLRVVLWLVVAAGIALIGNPATRFGGVLVYVPGF